MSDKTAHPATLAELIPTSSEPYITAPTKVMPVVDPVQRIELSPEQVADVLVDATTRTLASNIPGFNRIFDWFERVEQGSREVKLQILLKEFSSNFDSTAEALARLKILLDTRGGQTLFRKIIQIIAKGEEDIEWLSLLAKVLKNISEADLEKQFEERTFILSQIDRLSSHALLLLSKYEVWRQVNIDGTTTTSGQTAGDWIPKVTRFFMSKLNIHDLPMGARVNHSFHELESAGIINLQGHQLKLTAIGIEIQRSIESK